jgi:hypothetical protein
MIGLPDKASFLEAAKIAFYFKIHEGIMKIYEDESVIIIVEPGLRTVCSTDGELPTVSIHSGINDQQLM